MLLYFNKLQAQSTYQTNSKALYQLSYIPVKVLNLVIKPIYKKNVRLFSCTYLKRRIAFTEL